MGVNKMDELYPRFFKDAYAAGGWAQQASVFSALIEQYKQPPRAYHNIDHVVYCLDLLDDVKGLCDHPGDIAMALWFHDAIYEPLEKDNERQSAELALRELERLRVPTQRIENVYKLILATTHDHEPRWTDGRFMVDIDFAIIGESPENFDVVSEKIWEEYSPFVPRDMYTDGRIAFFKGVLEREHTYHTNYFSEQRGEQAKWNVMAEIVRLTLQHPGPL